MVQAINSQNIAVQKPANKPVNILDRSKAKLEAFKDTFNKSDNDTKAKVNTALGALGALGAIVGFAGAKNMIARCIGALVAFVSGASVAALNMPSNLGLKKEKAVIEQIPEADVVQQVPVDAQDAQAGAAPQAVLPMPAAPNEALEVPVLKTTQG